MKSAADAPIGVFDSGVGGLSVLRALRDELPYERFVYFADSGHAPYGERDGLYVVERSRHAIELLRHEHGIKVGSHRKAPRAGDETDEPARAVS